MNNFIKEVKKLDEAIYNTALAIGNIRSILNKTTDVFIAKDASEALIRSLSAYKEELLQLERLSKSMTEEEIIDKLENENLTCIKIGTGKKRELYTTEYSECKYLYVE